MPDACPGLPVWFRHDRLPVCVRASATGSRRFAARSQNYACPSFVAQNDACPSFVSFARRMTGKLGWERLGGDGAAASQTPLATLHAFKGWADKFTSTPPQGLEDRYALAVGKLGSGRLQDKLTWTLAWHEYRAALGGADYGREFNASLGFPLPGGLTGLVKLADYRSDGVARDTLKAWLQVEWSY